MADIHKHDVVVIGGGPAGIAAATCAAEGGASTLLVDDNPRLGGQVWRSSQSADLPTERGRWIERFKASGCRTLSGTRIVDRLESNLLLADNDEGVRLLEFSKLILATGARELLLPFPGWTLPNVFAAGGLQALVKGGVPVEGKRIVVVGTGPLLLAVASYLRKHRANVLLIAEQASFLRVVNFGTCLLSSPAKLSQALNMALALRGVKFRFGCWPIAARGDEILREVELQSVAGTFTIPCDYLACGYGLVPNLELPLLLGCEVVNGFVAVDEFQQTSIAGIYCAGEPTGIGGVDAALCEGQIAGLAATGRDRQARTLRGARTQAKRFERRLSSTFAIRPELRELCDAGTLVCRCEDVSYGRLQRMTSWREAKLQTRCGMGACQGRTCGAAAEFLFGWHASNTRPPVFPARVETLAMQIAVSQK